MKEIQEMNLITEVPESSRPRERMEEFGEKALSDQELLAILLRTGSKNKNVMHLAMQLLDHFENLYDLKMATLEEIKEIKGIGRVKALELKAAMELGSRLNHAGQVKLGTISSSSDFGHMMIMELQDLQQEHLVVIFLNTKNEIIKKETIFVGSLNQSIAHPREIFRGAVRYSAARIILAHNHPSGNPDPSKKDIQFTERMVACGEMMGIELLDHLIIGRNEYISLKEIGKI